jgi:uncharacterized lipoprotein YajG
MSRVLQRLAVALVAIVLSGCAGAMPGKADLMVDTANQAEGVYPASLDVIVIGRDKRPDPSVILYDMEDEQPQRIANRVPPHILVKESLVQGLRQQGLQMDERANISITVLINDLQAKVTKPHTLYVSQAKTRLQVIVGHLGNIVTLEYNREANKESLTRPGIPALEEMLDDQLTETITRILSDQRFQVAIKGR